MPLCRLAKSTGIPEEMLTARYPLCSMNEAISKPIRSIFRLLSTAMERIKSTSSPSRGPESMATPKTTTDCDPRRIFVGFWSSWGQRRSYCCTDATPTISAPKPLAQASISLVRFFTIASLTCSLLVPFHSNLFSSHDKGFSVR